MSFSLGKLSHLSFCVTADGFVCYISILFYSFAKLQWRLHIRQLSNSAAPQLPNVCLRPRWFISRRADLYCQPWHWRCWVFTRPGQVMVVRDVLMPVIPSVTVASVKFEPIHQRTCSSLCVLFVSEIRHMIFLLHKLMWPQSDMAASPPALQCENATIKSRIELLFTLNSM